MEKSRGMNHLIILCTRCKEWRSCKEWAQVDEDDESRVRQRHAWPVRIHEIASPPSSCKAVRRPGVGRDHDPLRSMIPRDEEWPAGRMTGSLGDTRSASVSRGNRARRAQGLCESGVRRPLLDRWSHVGAAEPLEELADEFGERVVELRVPGFR